MSDTTERERLTLALEEVRAILAPLLDEPYIFAPMYGRLCRWCGRLEDDPQHTPNCPTRRRDTLLGRSP